jgi:hypothetical protein
MLGRDGTISMWSIDFVCIGRHYVGKNNKLVPDYFTDMLSLYPSPMIAITSTDRSIGIYEFGNRGDGTEFDYYYFYFAFNLTC